jgi:hypothetical protein
MARKAQERKQDQAATSTPDLPNKAQADAARELAQEQKKLQEEARQAAADLARRTPMRSCVQMRPFPRIGI